MPDKIDPRELAERIARPEPGDTVKVWPAPEFCAKGKTYSSVLANPGRFLLAAGEAVLWSPFLAARFANGEVLLHDPQPAAEVAGAPIPPPKEG